MTSLVVVVAVGVGLWWAVPRALRVLIERRLGGYVQEVVVPDPAKPERLAEGATRRVAVLGGGVAGLTAAQTLASRGFQVTLVEANEHLGGKLGSWPVDLAPGRRVWVSHGFHAFFPNYLNLNAWLQRLGLWREFRSIGDYVIVGADHTVRFADLDRTPIFNLLSLARAGVFRLGEALKPPGRDLYGLFLEYDHATNFQRYDHLSFGDFNRLARVPPRLKVAFNTFARAFFADEDRLSLAELLKSFHFYYLGQDGGLVYDYPLHDYEPAFLAPLRAELGRLGAQVKVGTRVRELERQADGGYRVDGEAFDAVVLATDVVGSRAIISASRGLPAEVVGRFSALKEGQRYAVLRIWCDKDLREDLPVFVITDRIKVLDAVAVYHRIEAAVRDDLAAHGGRAVLELHCYAVPDGLDEAALKASLVEELQALFPETAGLTVQHEVFQVKQDMTAFHVGLGAARPTVETGVRGLVCAGDWVHLPFPAMLLECACASGLLAANALLRAEGLREERVRAVGNRGVMAGMPQPPARDVLRAPR